MNALLQGTYKLPKKALSPQVFPYLRTFIFIVASAYVFRTLSETNLYESVSVLVKELSFSYLLLMTVLLVPFNYFLEALKWQHLVKKVQSLTLTQAFSGVLAGMAASFVTPGGIGDYFGRILYATPGSREKLPAILLICRTSQMVVTMFFGCLSILFLLGNEGVFYAGIIWIGVVSLLISTVLTLGFSCRGRIIRYILKRKRGDSLKKYIEVVRGFTTYEIARLFFLALIRHTVFIVQLMLLLFWFGVSEDYFLLFLGVNFIFLCKSIIPVFFELGAREYAAVIFFSFFNVAVEPALMASLLLWILNIVAPSLAGLPFLLKLKASRT